MKPGRVRTVVIFNLESASRNSVAHSSSSRSLAFCIPIMAMSMPPYRSEVISILDCERRCS